MNPPTTPKAPPPTPPNGAPDSGADLSRLRELERLALTLAAVDDDLTEIIYPSREWLAAYEAVLKAVKK